MLDIPLKQFEEARLLMKEKGLSTPLIRFHGEPKGRSIWLKAECLQPAGSFKIRGATYFISRLSGAQKKKGVIAYSTGNHSQAVALAARNLGIKATIIMTTSALPFKVDATRRFGAEVLFADKPTTTSMRAMAEAMAEEQGLALIPPFDHPDVITGQGTIGLEILEQLDPAAVFVPVGGGGLISGIAMAIKKKNPKVKLIGVEVEMENDAYRSFHEKKHHALSGPSESLADAIKIQSLGKLTYPLVNHYVDDMVQLSEPQMIDATLAHAEVARLIVEPSGALSLAAALAYDRPLTPDKPIVCVASGGNICLSLLCKLSKNRLKNEKN